MTALLLLSTETSEIRGISGGSVSFKLTDDVANNDKQDTTSAVANYESAGLRQKTH